MTYEQRLRNAYHEIDSLYYTREKTITETIHGDVRGHYAGSEYFFYANGNEVFRSRDQRLTIQWLAYAKNI